MTAPASRLCLSLSGEDLATVGARLAWLEGRVGLVELRLDLLPASVPLSDWCRRYATLDFLASYRLVEEGGAGQGGAPRRRQRLQEAAAAGCAWVDQPLEDPPYALPPQTRRVHSWHAPVGVSDGDGVALAAAYAKAQRRATAGEVIKLVSWAERSADAAPALALQRSATPGRLIAFAQGPGGAASRLLCLRAGAPWTYLCWPGEATAPGQWSLADIEALPQGWSSAATPLIGVAGWPIAHSYSPWLWHMAGALADPPLTLLDVPLAAESLSPLLDAMRPWQLRALSVTMPLKGQAAQLSSRAPAEEAVNYLIGQADGSWEGGNSDGIGALAALNRAGLKPGSPLLVLGAGGAARAIVAAATAAGHDCTVAAREPARAAWAPRVVAWQEATPEAYEAVVQATPLGSRAQPGLALAGRPPRAGALALDLVYDPPDTAWLEQARQAGARLVPGIDMLFEQMLPVFRRTFPSHRLEDEAVAALFAAFHDHVKAEQAIALIGPRASGKTTLGRALAAALGWTFIDADVALERRHQRSLAAWIEDDEASFRTAEAELLPQLLGCRRTVLALGGGVVEAPNAVDRLRQHGQVLALQAPPATRVARQRKAPRPPLMATTVEVETAALDARREPLYRACASATLRSDCPLQQTVAQALHLLGKARFGPGQEVADLA